jgi:hypothetical protein
MSTAQWLRAELLCSACVDGTVEEMEQYSISWQIYLAQILSPQCRVLPEKLIVAQLGRNSQNYMDLEGPLSCSQEPAADPSPESDECSPHHVKEYGVLNCNSVVWRKPNVLEEHSASIFRVEE